MMKEPKYFLAVFGKPELPDKDTVDSGRYYLGQRGTDTPGERGDLMLLYCTATDEEYFMSAPGIGIILTKTKEFIFYRYLPFSLPITKDHIEKTFAEDDANKLKSIRSNTYWLFDISNESFRKATSGVLINWP
jgi:hypothetical protein